MEPWSLSWRFPLCVHAFPSSQVLTHTWVFTHTFTSTICTPASCCAAKPRNPVAAGTRLALIGLGELGNGTDPTTLQRTDLVLESLETCNAAYANWPDLDNFLEGTYICAGAYCLHLFAACWEVAQRLE